MVTFARSKDFSRKLAHALSIEYCESVHPNAEIVVHKTEELVQEANRLHARSANVETQLATVEADFRNCRDALDRTIGDKEQLQRQVSSQLIDLDRLRQVDDRRTGGSCCLQDNRFFEVLVLKILCTFRTKSASRCSTESRRGS